MAATAMASIASNIASIQASHVARQNPAGLVKLQLAPDVCVPPVCLRSLVNAAANIGHAYTTINNTDQTFTYGQSRSSVNAGESVTGKEDHDALAVTALLAASDVLAGQPILAAGTR